MKLCCDPRWYHGTLRHTCEAKNGVPYRGDQRANQLRAEQHRIEDARAGITQVWDLVVGLTKPAIRTECSWHADEGIEFTTSGICTGPFCTAYLESHADDRADA